VLFLDEPTIGLDVVAQHNIQKFLKFYQQKRKITILLTSHYMKDVAALCQRVVIIAQGAIQYDGSLDGIIDQFSGHKMITLQLAEGASVEELSGYGQVMEATSPKVKLKIPRQQVPRVLSEVLSRFPVEDVAVEDPPLEEVIAEVFSQVNRPEATDEEIAAVATKA
jgi:ABC-2 type transport system ATP-binding protein